MDPLLASIWDEPLAQDSPKRPERNDDDDDEDAPHRPAKRARQALFLADSDDDMDPGPSNRVVRGAPPAQDLNIDALFEGFEDDDDEISRPLPTMIDEDELTRQAEAEYRRKMPPLTPHEILPSSSPSRDTERTGGKKGKDGKEKGNEEKKARRRVIKLDENRLLGVEGFPQLIKMTKDFKIKGKGHEATDLDRLLQRYQYWTHQLYPKTMFQDTVDRVEKLTHSRRMTVALSVWRDEAHGRTGPMKPEEDDDDDGNENDKAMNTDDHTTSLPPSSPPRSSRPSSLSPPADSRGAAPQSMPLNEDIEKDDDEAFWKSLDMGLEESLSDAPPAPSTGPTSSMDEDEDMWDIVNEIEQGTSTTSTSAPVAAGPVPQNQPADDDWDDMYV